MYVAVKGGETAIAHSLDLLADKRRGDRDVAELSLEQIDQQLGLAVDRVMTEGSCYDRALAALAIKQARGDLIEAIFLLRAYRTTLAALRRQRADRHHDHGRGAAHLGAPSRTYRAARCWARPTITPIGCSTSRWPPPASGRRRRPRRSTARRPCRGSATSSSATGCSSRRRQDGEGGRPHAPAAHPAGVAAARLQNLARGDEGFLLALGYSTQRGYGNNHPFVGEIRFGSVPVSFVPEELGFAIEIADIDVTECDMVNQFAGSHDVPPQFTRGYGLAFGHAERKAMAMALVDRALRARGAVGKRRFAGAGRGVRAGAFRQCRGLGLRAASQAAALCRLPVRAGDGAGAARGGRAAQSAGGARPGGGVSHAATAPTTTPTSTSRPSA